MPWKHEWVEPEIAFSVAIPVGTQNWKDIYVYHAYKNNDAAERLCYWYTLCDGTSGQDSDSLEFDIRSFPTYDDSWNHHRIMQRAIDAGLCTIEDVFIYIEKTKEGNNAQH